MLPHCSHPSRMCFNLLLQLFITNLLMHFLPLLVLCLRLCVLSFVITPWRPGSNYYYCLSVVCHQPSTHHKPIDIKMLCDLWSRGQFGVLWRLAICHSKIGSATESCNKSLRPRLEYTISLAQDGLYSKACQVLTSSGIVPNTPETW